MQFVQYNNQTLPVCLKHAGRANLNKQQYHVIISFPYLVRADHSSIQLIKRY